MIVVRNCFVARPGQASKLAAQLKEAAGAASGLARHRVLTDLTGDFNRVILEYEAENVGEFETRMKDYATNAVPLACPAFTVSRRCTGRRLFCVH